MLRRVGITALGVDQTRSFTIIAVGEALASFTKLLVRCEQLDGSVVPFDILAGEIPTARPGPNGVRFSAADVWARNDGGMAGTLFIRIKDDLGTELMYIEFYCNPGESMVNSSVVTEMPSRNYGITVECGHL